MILSLCQAPLLRMVVCVLAVVVMCQADCYFQELHNKDVKSQPKGESLQIDLGQFTLLTRSTVNYIVLCHLIGLDLDNTTHGSAPLVVTERLIKHFIFYCN